MGMKAARAWGYQFGDIRVDVRARRIHRRGQPLHLDPKGWDVLLLFLDNPGRVIEKQELLDTVWKDVSVTESALTRVIADLRHTLRDDGKAQNYIETVHRVGYRFVADIRVTIPAGEPAPEPQVSAGANPGQVAPAEPVAASVTSVPEAAAGSAAAAVAFPPRWTPGPRVWGGALLVGCLVALFSVPLVLGRFYAGGWSFGAAEGGGPPQAIRLTTWSGLDGYPAISPDGRSLAFTSDRTGTFELYVRQLIEGGRELQVTSDGQQNTQPAWSPDGQLLAYHSGLRGGIWIVPALGGSARQLSTFGSRPAFAPAGTQIAFHSEALADMTVSPTRVSSASTIWVVSVNGGAPRPLTEPNAPPGGHAAPAWSPDGTRLTFMAASGGSTSFWSVAADGRASATRVECGDTTCSDGAYAANSFFFASAGRGPSTAVWRVPVAPNGMPTGPRVQLAASAGLQRYRHLSATRDGDRVSYALMATSRNLWRVAVASPTEAAPLTSDASGYSMPEFSPDGTRLAFVSGRAGSHPEVWIADADATSPRPLASGTRAIFPSWFPDGRRVVAAVPTSDPVWRAWNVDGGEPSALALPPAAEHVRVSPDGQRVAYDLLSGDTRNVWVSSVDGRSPVQITHERAAEDPCWSPDGQWLAFEIKREHDTHIGLAPSRGGRVEMLVTDRGPNLVHSWNSRSNAVAFAALRAGIWNIWTVSQQTSVQQQITRNTRANGYMRYPTWAPDGRSIVYEYGETTGQIWLLHLGTSARRAPTDR